MVGCQEIIETSKVTQEKPGNELALVQITASNKHQAKTISKHFSSMDVCNDTYCFRADVIQHPKNNVVANIAVSNFNDTIKYIRYVKKDHNKAHTPLILPLPNEYNLTKGTPYKLYIGQHLKPVLLTIFSPVDKPYLYNPNKKLKIKLKDGFKLVVPKKTFSEYLTFNVSSTINPSNIASSYYIGLAKDGISAEKNMTAYIPLNETNLTSDEIKAKYEPTMKNKSLEFTVIEKNDKSYMKVIVSDFGYLGVREKESKALNVVQSRVQKKATNKSLLSGLFGDDLSTCLLQIQSLNPKITTETETEGYAQFNGCTNMQPYINVVSLNINADHNEVVPKELSKTMEIGLSFAEDNKQLKTIEKHAFDNGAKIAINGGQWDGDLGVQYMFDWSSGGFVDNIAYGTPKEKTIYRNETLDFNLLTVSTKSSLGMTSSRNEAKLFKLSEETPKSPYLYNLYSSANYILHKGKCNESDSKDARSAIGIKNGKILFISSNHEYSAGTSTTELCEIFQAFGYENAILNDGGSASSMYVNGSLVNPLTGVDRISIGGTSRQILYSITAKFSK